MAKKKTSAKKKKKPSRKKSASRTVVPKAAARKKPKRKKTSTPRVKELDLDVIATVLEDGSLSVADQQLADALQRNAKAVEKAFAGGRDVNKRLGGKNGFTPLMIAASVAAPASIIKFLLSLGADPKLDPVLLLCDWEVDKVKMLLKAGADANATDGVSTPLLNAVSSRERETVKLLIKAGAKATDAVTKEAKKWKDPMVMKLLGKDKPVPQSLYIPPLLSKPLKEGYRKVFDLTGWPPLGVEGMTLFRCQIEPDRFLTEKEALSSRGLEKAANIVAKKLYGSVDGCEFVRSDLQDECVLMIGSNNKFHFWKKPKKLHDWLKEFDAEHPMSFSSIFSGASEYLFARKLPKAAVTKWTKSFKELGHDGISAKIDTTRFKLKLDT